MPFSEVNPLKKGSLERITTVWDLGLHQTGRLESLMFTRLGSDWSQCINLQYLCLTKLEFIPEQLLANVRAHEKLNWCPMSCLIGTEIKAEGGLKGHFIQDIERPTPEHTSWWYNRYQSYFNFSLLSEGCFVVFPSSLQGDYLICVNMLA